MLALAWRKLVSEFIELCERRAGNNRYTAGIVRDQAVLQGIA